MLRAPKEGTENRVRGLRAPNGPDSPALGFLQERGRGRLAVPPRSAPHPELWAVLLTTLAGGPRPSGPQLGTVGVSTACWPLFASTFDYFLFVPSLYTVFAPCDTYGSSFLEGRDLLIPSAPWGRKLPMGADCPWQSHREEDELLLRCSGRLHSVPIYLVPGIVVPVLLQLCGNSVSVFTAHPQGSLLLITPSFHPSLWSHIIRSPPLQGALWLPFGICSVAGEGAVAGGREPC